MFLNNNQIDQIVKKFFNFKKLETKQYIKHIFQITNPKITLQIYDNNKLLIQGSVENKVNFWNRNQDFWKSIKCFWYKAKPDNSLLNNCILTVHWGGDESGKGDYFGSIHVTLFKYTPILFQFVKNNQIRDSKKIADRKILILGQMLLNQYPNLIYTTKISPQEINASKNINILISNAYYTLMKKNITDTAPIIIDGFVNQKTFWNYFSSDINPNLKKQVKLIKKAEDQVYAVALASIISRYHFIKEIENASQNFKFEIPKGASIKCRQLVLDLLKDNKTAKELINLIKTKYLK